MFFSSHIGRSGIVDPNKAEGTPEEREESYQATVADYEARQAETENINHTVITDRDTLTRLIRENGYPSYSPDKLALERKAALRETARRAVFRESNEIRNGRGARALEAAGIQSPRAVWRSMAFADHYVPGGKELIDTMVSLGDEYSACEAKIQARRDQMDKLQQQRTELIAETVKYVKDNRKELESRLAENAGKELSAEELQADAVLRAVLDDKFDPAGFKVEGLSKYQAEDIALSIYGKQVPEARSRVGGLKQLDTLKAEQSAFEKPFRDRQAEIKPQMESVKGRIWRESVKYAQEHAAEFENLLAREMTDEELLEKWPEYGALTEFYKEGESFSGKGDKINSLLTQPLLARGTQLQQRVDLLSSELGGMVDMDELMKLSQSEIRDVIGALPMEDERVSDLNVTVDYLRTQIRDQYMMGTMRHFNIDPQKGAGELLLQDMEGNVHEADSPEAWKLLHVRQEPVFAVPKADPGAEPVLVQPLTREGTAATGKSFQNVTMPKLDPVKKPNAVVYGFHSFLKSVGKVFGANLGLDSCREYDKYAEKLEKQAELQKNIDKAAEQYEKLNAPDKLKQAAEKFAAHTGDTPASLKEKHEKFIAENPQGVFQEKAKESARSIKDLEIRKITEKLDALKQSVQGPGADDCERFAEEMTQLVTEQPSTRKLVTRLVGLNMTRFLFETYRDRQDEKGFSLGGFLDTMKGDHETSLAEKQELQKNVGSKKSGPDLGGKH